MPLDRVSRGPNRRSCVLDRELDQRAIRGGRNCVSRSGDGRRGCIGGSAKRRAIFRVTIQSSAMAPETQAEQHDPLPASPWQCLDPLAQQARPLIANPIAGDGTAPRFATTTCSSAILEAFWTACAPRTVGLVPTGQAWEDSTIASANNVKVVRMRAVRASQQPTPCTSLSPGWRRRPLNLGTCRANMPRLSESDADLSNCKIGWTQGRTAH
jgi:hypothetical protein